ncbi:DUF1735 domain-containing protein [uncultured Muribaculum sp.]|uniref:DUF1735 domain-containing protein n=1 Tax=uncultured Muribaculum sp. TaxID=1918613 RepID=UPI0025F36D1E|nr:DUF1735 domain-containing protein [uncultured Muribaculum sp.]
MKKFQKYLSVCAVAVMLAPLASCDDDDTVDPYDINYCFIYQPNSTFAQLEYKANGQFLIDINDPLALKPVRLTKPAPRNINVEIAIDPTLVDEYNQANGTSYVFLEGASIVNPMLTIPQGEYISHDPVTVTFGDKKAFQTENTDLILPIVIRNADGMAISKSSRVFLTFTSTYRANGVTPIADTRITIDPDVDGWESAFTSYTINDFLTTEWAADDAITVKATIDNSLIDAYNSEHNTDYKPLQATITDLNIPAGASKANLALTFGDYTGIAQNDKFLVPVKLSITSGAGAELSSDVAYVKVIQLPLELECYSTLPGTYTQIPYESTWSGMLNGDTAIPEEIFTNPKDNTVYLWTPIGSTMAIDLGSVKNVNVMNWNFWLYYYAINSASNIQTSADGQNWSDWGDVTLRTSAGAQYNYIKFSKTAKFRYIRWTNGDYAFNSTWEPFYIGIVFYGQ